MIKSELFQVLASLSPFSFFLYTLSIRVCIEGRKKERETSHHWGEGISLLVWAVYFWSIPWYYYSSFYLTITRYFFGISNTLQVKTFLDSITTYFVTLEYFSNLEIESSTNTLLNLGAVHKWRHFLRGRGVSQKVTKSDRGEWGVWAIE